jgi:hypothetical protein
MFWLRIPEQFSHQAVVVFAEKSAVAFAEIDAGKRTLKYRGCNWPPDQGRR